ncbi:RING finger protein 227-like [Protopterus annectens]|uniref:RING finger protein 227-like n=1 Tax=Protopterus annectens TaxID=7888 RepID=UPI001CF9494C|nr:RING finger protein 227-like [Protopterus annectens]
MDISNELDCGICYLPYTRSNRPPRRLHCGHSFCEECLRKLVWTDNGQANLYCPLCRQLTNLRKGLPVVKALHLDMEMWWKIPLDKDEDEEDLKKQNKSQAMIYLLSPSKRVFENSETVQNHKKSILPKFLKKLTSAKKHRKRKEDEMRLEMEQTQADQMPSSSVA